jgi:hypothetical protein
MSAGACSDPAKQLLINMKKVITCLTAGLLVIGAQSLRAQSSTNTTSSATTETPAAPAAHKALTPEQRKERREAMKLIGLDAQDLKGLSREERADKVKDALEKFKADEKAKKDAGTFTSEDKDNVALVEKVFGHHHKPKPTADN